MDHTALIRDQLCLAQLRTAVEDAPTTATQRQRLGVCLDHLQARLFALAALEGVAPSTVANQE